MFNHINKSLISMTNYGVKLYTDFIKRNPDKKIVMLDIERRHPISKDTTSKTYRLTENEIDNIIRSVYRKDIIHTSKNKKVEISFVNFNDDLKIVDKTTNGIHPVYIGEFNK